MVRSETAVKPLCLTSPCRPNRVAGTAPDIVVASFTEPEILVVDASGTVVEQMLVSFSSKVRNRLSAPDARPLRRVHWRTRGAHRNQEWFYRQ